MLQYILECIAFQLVFLIIYDLFLKRETFFQWNRVYLICTYIFSMILPWVKIEALKTEAPEVFQGYSEFLWNTNDAAIVVSNVEESSFNMPWEYVVLFSGMFLAASFLGYKLYQIYTLKQKGEVKYFKHFTRIVIANSSLAFSFFKSIFLGDKVLEKEHQNILEHELVHIREKHSYDLMFFELMRIVGWFNPLVYVYQNRVSELHEFIADATVAKTNKKEQYQFLLSQVFQTQNISFINQFFNSSLIKKRIVMLQKTRSKKIWQLKYLLLLPLIFGLLIYTSCEVSAKNLTDGILEVQSVSSMTLDEKKTVFKKVKELESTGKYWEFSVKDKNATIKYVYADNGSYIEFDGEDESVNGMLTVETNSLSERINDLREEIESKDSLTMHERGQLALMIYDIYPEGVEGISGEKGNLEFSQPFEERLNQSEKDFELAEYFEQISDSTDKGKTQGFIKNRLKKISNNTSIERYNQLVIERQRLLKSSNEKNPVIVNLDAQIAELKNSLPQEKEQIAFAKVDEVPVFPGCKNENDQRECFQKSMQRHISKNFRYPQEAQEKGIQGRVSIMFTVNIEGNVTNVRMRGPHKLLEGEAARIIAKLPKMLPGKHGGKVVGVSYSIPITFRLQQQPDEFQFINEEGEIFDDNQKSSVKMYNELIRERKRLLKSSNDANPVIVNLDEQLSGLRLAIYHDADKVTFGIIDEVPVFPGCEDEENRRACFNKMMQKHIGENFTYPKEAKDKGIEGRVNIMFTIGKNGVIKNLRMRGPDKLLEGEAKRIMMRLPDMKPGVHKGKKVDVPFSMPISFKLQDTEGAIEGMNLALGAIKPLIIIDGKESTKEVLDEMNPKNIATINVLKDESAIEKYGDKGNKGVVVIVTKKKD